MRDDIERRVTAPGMDRVVGNRLFASAVTSLGLDVEMGARVLADVLLGNGVKPIAATAEDLRGLLPAVERRLRAFVNDDMVGAAMSRLRQTIDGGGGDPK
jgi:hypothetical protein